MGVLENLVADSAKNRPRNGNGKKTYQEENGTTRVGDALRWLKQAGRIVAPELLTMAGTLTGVQGLVNLGGAIRGSDLADIDKEYALKQLELDIVEEQEVTKRWEADMNSDSGLSKNIRPAVLAVLILTTLTIAILDSAMDTFTLQKEWFYLLGTLDATALGGYFTLRQLGENAKIKKLRGL